MRPSLSYLLLLLLCPPLWAQEIAVVVPIKSPIQELTTHEVANIFLSKTTRSDEGLRIKTLELNSKEYKALFYGKISGKSLSQLKSYWSTIIFTGKGMPPKSFDNTSGLILELKQNDLAITYLPYDQVDTSMRVVYSFIVQND
ncbi:MAG: hypothetical protein OEZ16_04575 [Chromatiales bacterium]|nr:hypothetical protein [Chromatiales bacterium]